MQPWPSIFLASYHARIVQVKLSMAFRAVPQTLENHSYQPQLCASDVLLSKGAFGMDILTIFHVTITLRLRQALSRAAALRALGIFTPISAG